MAAKNPVDADIIDMDIEAEINEIDEDATPDPEINLVQKDWKTRVLNLDPVKKITMPAGKFEVIFNSKEGKKAVQRKIFVNVILGQVYQAKCKAGSRRIASVKQIE